MRERGRGVASVHSPGVLESDRVPVHGAVHDIARDPVEGQRLFASKGCDRCHATSDTGERTAPRLAELGRWTTSVLMAAAMWNHVSQMGDAMDAAGVTRPPSPAPSFRTSSPTSARRPATREASRRRWWLACPTAANGCSSTRGVRGATRSRTRAPHRGEAWGPVHRGRPSPSFRWCCGIIASTTRTLRLPASRDRTWRTSPPTSTRRITSTHRPVTWQRGRRLLEDKGCLGCHSLYGKGGSSAPDFSKSNVVSSKVGQLTAMWNHGRRSWRTRRSDGP